MDSHVSGEPLADAGTVGSAIAVPVLAARFMLHLKTHGIVYAVGWLVLDASGTWAALTAQAGNVCG